MSKQMEIDGQVYKDETTFCDRCKMEMPKDVGWLEYLEIWKSKCKGEEND